MNQSRHLDTSPSPSSLKIKSNISTLLVHGITIQLFVGHVPTVPAQGRSRVQTLVATDPAMIWREIEVANGIGGVKINILGGARLDTLRNVRDEPFPLAVAQLTSKEAVVTGPASPCTLHPINGKSVANFLRSLVEAIGLGESCSSNGGELFVGAFHYAVAAETRIIVVIGVHIGVIRVCVRVAMVVSPLVVTYSLGVEKMMNLRKQPIVLTAPLLDNVVFLDEALDGVQIPPAHVSIATAAAKLGCCAGKSKVITFMATTPHDIIDAVYQPIVPERDQKVKHLQVGTK